MSSVVERFLRYVKIDTQSDHHTGVHPSTDKQLDLARLLMDELQALGLTEIEMDPYGNVTATLPANTGLAAPTIGLLAHMDTSPDLSGANVNPQVVEKYTGGDIVLNQAQNIVLSPREFPDLKAYIGKTLITTDGTTLLGADDKAGVAEIMAGLEMLVNQPEIRHGKVRIGFTTDEEVGTGIDLFDVQKFGADFAYTFDGEGEGALQYENFNAARAQVTFKGRSVHPGYSKNKMVNAGLVAIEFNDLLPPIERPEFTENYEGFFHLTQINGNVESANLSYIIRDHDRAKFEGRKELMRTSAHRLNEKYGPGTVILELTDQYANMREKIEPVMHVVELAKQAMQALGISPSITPVRGGTDGARLSWKGLPTPNVFAGGHNAHGRYEYIPASSLESAANLVVKLVEFASK